jgi:ParB/RepB/Spo0J family partition protein
MEKENKMTTLMEVALREIVPNPFNPRKSFSGPKFDELVESVKQKGVIEPIIIRPVKGKKTPYEVVVGERRFKAAGMAKLEKIPALVRELSDDEAYDFMLIENLQREDLTELEEAESFKAYTRRHGKEAVKELAEKTGIRPAYIRARVAVLALPAEILAAWRKGTVHYAHLEQFLRLPEKSALKETLAQVKRNGTTAAELKRQINKSRIPLDSALFAAKTTCGGCQSNSTVQQDLFDLGDGKAACLSPGCFKMNQGAWLGEHWLETEIAKKDKTRGFRFDQDVRYHQREEFYGYSGTKPAKKCLECDSFVTLIEITGARREHGDAIACVGDKKCFGGVREASRQIERAADRGEKKKAVEAGNAPRCAWHGRYFRDLFYRGLLPKKLEAIKPESPSARTLLLLTLANAHHEARDAVAKALGAKDSDFSDKTEVALKILKDPEKAVKAALGPAIAAALLEGLAPTAEHYDGSELSPEIRAAVGTFLGIDLAKEWSADEEYLQKKTRNELLAFGKKSGIFTAGVVKEYLTNTLKKKPGAFESCKKSELVDVFLKSGVDLVGRVPSEILK